MMMEKKVNGNTKTAADMALRRKAISQESHAAVLAGELGLQEAKDLGRNAGPSGPVGPAPKAVNKSDRSRDCACGCGLRTSGGKWRPGHDQRAKGMVVRAVREGTLEQLSDELQEYAVERDLIAQTERRVAEEERKRQENAAKTK